MRSQTSQILQGSYALAKRSGVLGTSLGSCLFTNAYFLYKRYVEDDLQHLLRSRPNLLRGGNVLDVGANLGYTAQLLARSTEAGQYVYAFEPEPFNYEILRRIAGQPEFSDRITAVQCAVGAEEGTVELWQNAHHHADHRVITEHFQAKTSALRRVSVPMVTIDGFLERNPGPVCFIKIDVQGFELPVCEGMTTTLERNPCVTIVLEYDPTAMRELGFDPSHLTKFMADRGFECYLIGRNGKLSPGIPYGLENGRYVDVLFSSRPIAYGVDA